MSATGSRRPTVLLVDDCVADRKLYETVLASEFEVVTASRGLDALALAGLVRPDVVVLDVMMPGLNGWDTCVLLKADEITANTPVVMLTGADDPNLVERARAVGAAGIETKPCPADRLLNRIRGAMGIRGKAVWGN